MFLYYPDSKVEIEGFTARHYDLLLNLSSLGFYFYMIRKAISLMKIKPADRILDLGAGTGRNAHLISKRLSPKGHFTGLDISEDMISQFQRKFVDSKNIEIFNRRIDIPQGFSDEFDKVLISFVLHGFPQDARIRIIQNAYNSLKTGGEFFILDFNEFNLKDMPFFLKIPFMKIECPYAFDFIEKNWKSILYQNGFGSFESHYFFAGYIRLLKGSKI
ncbi:class I SAM-dependent methyltransferase [candidate division WOR-3 bacterium]|nr:class I SAM-dependent methyltransferase [candidate division WOR-3 bacterium]